MHSRFRQPSLLEIGAAVIVLTLVALVSIPRFLSAQLSANVAKVHRDLGILSAGLLAYKRDNACYFNWQSSNPHAELMRLTTPVAYLPAIPEDPYRTSGSVYRSTTSNYDYTSVGGGCAQDWVLTSLGPDTDEDASGVMFSPGQRGIPVDRLYSTTNGLLSDGDIAGGSWFDAPR